MTTPAQSPALADERSWTVDAPSKQVSAQVAHDAAGGLTLQVRRAGAPVTTSQLGLTTTKHDFTRDLRVHEVERAAVSERYQTAVGKRLVHRDTGRQLTVTVSEQTGARMRVQVRVFDDGAAYRYLLPGTQPVTVTSEASTFRVPADADGWLMEYRENYENQYQPVRAGAVEQVPYAFPALFKVGDTWTLFSESDVDGRYAAARLQPSTRPGAFDVVLPQASVTSSAPLATPWRLAVVGDLEAVVESDLVTDLASGGSVGVPAWVRPGMTAWSWWSDGGSPRSFERQKEYVDHAAEEGWEYVLVDEGWSPRWMPDLVAYAQRRDVGVVVWARWTDLQTPQQRDTLLPRWKSWGVAGVKVDFMNSDSQQRLAWYDAFLADAQQQRLMVNFHGSTLPHGLERRWPHLMTMEGVRGAEDYHLGSVTPQHNVALPFTRNVVGSMDYTPVTFSAERRETSAGHELALSVVYESGWQHPADSVESYDGRGVGEAVLRVMPTVWDQTEFLAGRPGVEATLARRSGSRWFVGSAHAGAPGAGTVPLRFLSAGRTYTAEVVRDRGDDELQVDTRTVQRGDRLQVPTAADGGFVVVLCPAAQGRCLDDALLSRVQVRPEEDFVAPGGATTVHVPVRNHSRAPLTAVDATLTVPGRWQTRALTPTRFAAIPPGATETASWRVQVPADAQRGSAHDLGARIRYRHGATEVGRSPAARVHVQPWAAPAGEAYLSDLAMFDSFNWVGPLERDMSNGGDQQGDGQPITIEGRRFDKGLGGHAHSEQVFYTGAACQRFTAHVGVDDEVGPRGSVVFQVWGDERKLFDSGPLTGSSAGVPVDVETTGVEALRLVLADGGDFVADDHGDWAMARLSCE